MRSPLRQAGAREQRARWLWLEQGGGGGNRAEQGAANCGDGGAVGPQLVQTGEVRAEDGFLQIQGAPTEGALLQSTRARDEGARSHQQP